jgi:hypothetical protein
MRKPEKTTRFLTKEVKPILLRNKIFMFVLNGPKTRRPHFSEKHI